MSGICAVLGTDGIACDAELATHIGDALRSRGPDAVTHHASPRALLVHALLRTAAEVPQGVLSRGDLVLVADARLDDRQRLRAELARAGCGVASGATDGDLIAAAYLAWAEDCVHHLAGDFCFALWDARRQRMFCARDQLGIKPFFWARWPGGVAVANDLRALLALPAVPKDLNDEWIADFLLFGASTRWDTTVYAGVSRLRPGHTLIIGGDGRISTQRYWSPAPAQPIEYQRSDDYVEHFRELLDVAIRERAAADTAIWLSGGLDSPSIASRFLRNHPQSRLHAYTVVYDSLIPDQERRFASIAASSLGLQTRFMPQDDAVLYGQYTLLESCPPEPTHDPEGIVHANALRVPAQGQRVLLTGYDGDALLNDSPLAYLRSLSKRGQWLSCIGLAAWYAMKHRRFWPEHWRRTRAAVAAPTYPAWLDSDFERRWALKDRWRQHHTHATEDPVRPVTLTRLRYLSEGWPFFERFDPGTSGASIEVRHPLMDLRVVNYCLAIPPVPWCTKKTILRRAMAHDLPPAIIERPKTVLQGDPDAALLRRPESRWVDDFEPVPELSRYIDRHRIPRVSGPDASMDSVLQLLPLSLNMWLQYRKQRSS